MSRQKKPPVRPEKRQEWLERNESGESPPKIAATDGFDARTVRKHIEVAKEEKETRQARASVLRNALESHYADLCRYAEKLIGQSTTGYVSESSMDIAMRYGDKLGIALRQHIPKSPIWGYLGQRTRLQITKDELIKELGTKIEENIRSDSRLRTELTDDESGVITGMVDAFNAQMQFWINDYATLHPEENLIWEPAGNGFVKLRYGAYQMGKVREDHIELIRTLLTEWKTTIEQWPEFLTLKKASSDLQRVENSLRDEIAVIALRRVVPGRCRYCPL